MIVHQIPVGPMQNFSYIVVDEDTSESVVIDPSQLVLLEVENPDLLCSCKSYPESQHGPFRAKRFQNQRLPWRLSK